MPSAEQLVFLSSTVERCIREMREENSTATYRSEPMRFMLHGVPGAGKSQTLLWLRTFFEKVCGWTHGKEFVYLASQNTMAALIGGFTVHSFNLISFKRKDGQTISAKRENKKDVSPHFLVYQRVR